MGSETTGSQEPLIGLASLMRQAYAGVDLTPLGRELIARAGSDPRVADANALLDLSILLQLRGERALAMEMQAQALQLRRVYAAPYLRGQADRSAAALRVLAVMGPGDLMANSPVECLLEDEDAALDIVYVTQTRGLPDALPEHDVLFVAVAESEANLPLLARLADQLRGWKQPVINDPARIASLSRDNNCTRLKDADGVAMPLTVRVASQALRQVASGELPLEAVLAGGGFPVIVRPVDSHAGKGLEKLDDAAALTGYLEGVEPGEYFVSRFVDYRNADGLFRKYRIMLIAGRPFLAHLAISEHWMIHYLNAGMADSAAKRGEEADCMAGFDGDFALRHADALCAIHRRFGLDYLGLDCAETADSRLLIFEVDSCMIVHAIDPVEIFPYKQAQMRKLFGAFRQMLADAAGGRGR